MSDHPDLTQLLNAQQEGAPGAADEAMPQVYNALRVIARNHLRQERSTHTLNPTALVHEAFVKLIDLDRVTWESRRHFFAMASRAMRRILVDYSRRTQADKRGGGHPHISVDDVPVFADLMPSDVLALDEALQRLEASDPRKAQVVQLRFFGGFSIEEVAELVDVSPATVRRDWTMAKAWLKREIDSR